MMNPTLEVVAVGTEGTETTGDRMTAVGIGTMIGTGRGATGEMTILTVDEMIVEMTDVMIDMSESDPSAPPAAIDELDNPQSMKAEDLPTGTMTSPYPKVMKDQDTRYCLKLA